VVLLGDKQKDAAALRWRGCSFSITSRAAFQTSASTQPPPMVPIMEPSSRTSSLQL
jgi:hypothetical protein